MLDARPAAAPTIGGRAASASRLTPSLRVRGPQGGSMRRIATAMLVALAAGAALAEEPARPPGPPAPTPPASKPPAIRLVHLRDGMRASAPKGDLARVGETDMGKAAASVGVDLSEPGHPLIAHRYAQGRLFYVFYKSTDDAFGDRPYLIQRIKKTERRWAGPEAPPEEKVTYQVEVFKVMAGRLETPDQHYGSFGLGESQRREVVKEYEIGHGEIPGRVEGLGWPYADDRRYALEQAYQPEVGLHDKVVFR